MFVRLTKLLVSLALLTAAGAECSGSSSDIKIYTLRYGNSMFQSRFVFYGDKTGNSIPFSWMFYYIEYGDKKILVDTGFNDPAMVKIFGITDFKDPVEILNDNGISADQITDVIITHSHFDHIGNAYRFKNARFIINQDELSALNKGKGLSEVKKFFAGNQNVIVFDESYLLYDMFNIKKIGGHTKGSSVVLFKYRDKDYCFTGDEVYLIDNVLNNTGNGSVVNHANNISFIDLLNKNKFNLFIFHDNRYLQGKERLIKVLPAR